MQAIKLLRDRLFITLGKAKVIIGGTITTVSPHDLYPTFIANEGLGGFHVYDGKESLLDIPTVRLQRGMRVYVNEHDDGTNTIPAATYRLIKVPTSGDKIRDVVGHTFEEYWVEVNEKGEQGEPGAPGEQGEAGVFDETSYWDGEALNIQGSSGSPEFGSWAIKLRKSKLGIVHYSIKTFKNGGGDVTFKSYVLAPKYIPASFDYAVAIGSSNCGVILDGGYHNNASGASNSNEKGLITIADGVATLKVPFRDDWSWVSNGSYITAEALSS